MRHSDRAVLLALAAGLALLAGCSDDAPTPTIPAGPPPATTTPPASSYGDQDRNERGNLVKTIGQPGAIQAASGDIALEFRVDAIRQNAECQADGYIDQPENGQFLAVDVFAKTTPAFRTSEQDTEFLNAGYNWSVVTGDGVRHNVDTGPAFGCSPSSRDNLGSLTPSVTVSGTVYLDAPPPTGRARCSARQDGFAGSCGEPWKSGPSRTVLGRNGTPHGGPQVENRGVGAVAPPVASAVCRRRSSSRARPAG